MFFNKEVYDVKRQKRVFFLVSMKLKSVHLFLSKNIITVSFSKKKLFCSNMQLIITTGTRDKKLD